MKVSNVQVLSGDCLEVLRAFRDNSVDSVCCDPPYGLQFMGKEWDSPAKMTMDVPNMTGGPSGGLHYGPGTNSRGYADIKESMPQFQYWCMQWAAECLRVLKPGGHMLAFGGTRTYHRLACAIEDAGFEIRDSLHWMYGSGFPKSLDVSKAIDKAARAERQILAPSPIHSRGANTAFPKRPGEVSVEESNRVVAQDQPMITAPATENAAQWEGWGTALKPAHEPIVVARKPLTGTVASNVLEWCTGGLNIDGCRVATTDSLGGGDQNAGTKVKTEGWDRPWMQDEAAKAAHAERVSQNVEKAEVLGRFPPNILLTHSAGCQPAGLRKIRGIAAGSIVMHSSAAEKDGNRSAAYGKESRREGYVNIQHGDADGTETIIAWRCVDSCPAAGLDAQSGMTGPSFISKSCTSDTMTSGYAGGLGGHRGARGHQDAGGASRFYPQLNWDPEYDYPFMYNPKASPSERPRIDGIAHPTCKPLALMRWLTRLVTPPQGIILDPFAGTGTTGEAALLEGFRCILIEKEEDYLKLIKVRLSRHEATLF